jgi:hypothetical protein
VCECELRAQTADDAALKSVQARSVELDAGSAAPNECAAGRRLGRIPQGSGIIPVPKVSEAINSAAEAFSVAGLMIRNRCMPVSRLVRPIVASILILVCATTALAPHAHGVVEGFYSPQQITECHASSPALTHLDASRTEREHPCIACASQHLSGLARAGRTHHAPPAHSTAFGSRPRSAETFGQTSVVFRRGPPPTSC